jgi:hypothetical protein
MMFGFGVECGGALLCRFGFSVLLFCLGHSTPQRNRKNKCGGALLRRTPHQMPNNLKPNQEKPDLLCAPVSKERHAIGQGNSP